MVAVEYRCGCGSTGEMIEHRVPAPDTCYPRRQYFIACGECGARSFRFAARHDTETNWAGMEGNAIEYTRQRDCRVA